MTLLDTALRYHNAGLVVLPNDPVAKYPAGFKGWETMEVTEAQIRAWYAKPGKAIGLRDVEGLDFDNKGAPDADTLYSEWYTLCEALAPGLAGRLLLEKTPSGGYHTAWRCEVIASSQKLATRPPTPAELHRDPRATFTTLIETRGKGGQFQVAPSPGYEIVRGDWTNLPTITPAERQVLLDAARALTQADARVHKSLSEKGDRPGDQYNAERGGEALTLLLSGGWVEMFKKGDVSYLCRPGKDKGVSATFGYVAPGVLYVFSSNASPFEAGRAYKPFSVFAELAHGGNYKKAAAALYGELVPTTAAPPAKPVGKVEYIVDFRQHGINAAALQKLEFAPLMWIVDGILPEGATLLAGKPKSKKSWKALGVAAAVAMGGKVLNYFDTHQGDVLYLDLESNQRRMKSRLAALLGATPWPENFHIFTKWERGEAGIALLDGWMEAHPKTKLVVIDIFQNFRPPRDPKGNPYDQDYEAIKMINEFAERHRIAVLVIHHTRKAKSDDVFDEISGTTGLSGGVASMWVLGRTPDNSGESVLAIRGRDISDDDPMVLRWDSYTCQFVMVATGPDASSGSARRAILEVMEMDQEYQLKDIAAAVGKPVNATSNQMRRLMDDNLVQRVGNGRYARVPSRISFSSVSRVSDVSSVSGVSGVSDLHDLHQLTHEESVSLDSIRKPQSGSFSRLTPLTRESIEGGVFDNVPSYKLGGLKVYLRSNIESDQERAREICEEFGVDYEAARKAAQL